MLFIVAAGLELQRSPESMKDETDHDQQRLIGVETPRAEMPLASTSGQNRFPGS
jgi:hypothetical protein